MFIEKFENRDFGKHNDIFVEDIITRILESFSLTDRFDDIPIFYPQEI